MGVHNLTKTFSSLRGFSTESPFVRPANVADKAVNLQRLADGTFSPRRGYQCQTSVKGGMGATVFDNKDSFQQVVTIDTDGLLYLQKTGTFAITYSPTYDYEWFGYEIAVDETATSDTTKDDFDPYAVVPWSALVADAILFNYTRKTRATVDGAQAGVTTITVDAGHSIQIGALVTFVDDINSEYITRAVASVGSTTVAITGAAVNVSNNAVIDSVYSDSINLGIGFDRADIFTLDKLGIALGAITDVSVVITGESDSPAALLNLVEPAALAKDKSVSLDFYYWKDANRTVAKTFSGLAGKIDDDDFENATFASYSNLLFIANRWDDVHKFDGQTVYLAGLPTGGVPIEKAQVPAGALTGDYKWYITYEQIDATGRLVEGRISPALEVTLTAEDQTLWLPTLEDDSGYNTNAAQVDGDQFAVAVNTITVDANHRLRPGDTAYFYDYESPPGYVTRNVDSTTSTTVTVSGAAVGVKDGEILSNNLRVNLYRTKAGGVSPYLVRSFPNNPSAVIEYVDDNLDATLVAEYIDPTANHTPPPRAAYIINYGNQLIYGGTPNSEDSIYFSEPNVPEYVDSVRNRRTVPSNNDNVTGLASPEGYLVIFKTQSIYVITGNLSTSQDILTQISAGGNIGCISHHSIAVIGSLVYFLHTNGVYSMTATQLFPLDKAGAPIPLSIPIDRFFRESIFDQNEKFVLKRSTCVNYTKDNQYLLFLPVEPIADNIPERTATTKSRVLCFDYQGKNWFEWTNVNAAGGWYVLNDILYWQERRIHNTEVAANQYRQHNKNRLVDQVDHVTPIHVTWRSSWEDINQPRVRKVFSRAVLLLDVLSDLQQKNNLSFYFKSFKDWHNNTYWTKKNITQQFNSNPFSTSQFSFQGEDGYQDSFITINLRASQVSKACQIQLQLNELNTTFALQGFQLEVDTDFRKEIVR
ncbi:MAG: hypothetical protein DRN30_04410 [Thermoplasmata archaeon]|nr:MAG: hypothetical protein DRN30_04410 [Thermoplasmata archaeon]